MNIFYTYLFLGLFSGKLPQYQKKKSYLKNSQQILVQRDKKTFSIK